MLAAGAPLVAGLVVVLAQLAKSSAKTAVVDILLFCEGGCVPQNKVDDSPEVVLGGRYRLGPLIGRGGMASVHEARDEALDRAVAVKLFRTDITDPDELVRQQVEAKLLARLNHPNLVTVFDAGTDTASSSAQTYLVMELVHGTDLRRAMHRRALPFAEVARVGAGVAAALEYIHRSGVIHRDVKPANILMNDDGGTRAPLNPKLTDFGIARLVDGARLTATGESLGTAMYFSPEQAAGEAIGPACDIYALGLVLLECLTGTTAFPGPAVASAAARLHRDPDIPDALGPQWRQLLEAMTQRDPHSRPPAGSVATSLLSLQKDYAAQGTGDGAHTEAISRVSTSTAALPEAPAGGLDGTAPGANEPTQPQPAAPPAPPESADATSDRPPLEVPEEDTGPGVRRAGTPTRRRKMMFAVVIALVLTAIAVVLILALPSGTEPGTLPYPAVPGELGVHLAELQESVEP